MQRNNHEELSFLDEIKNIMEFLIDIVYSSAVCAGIWKFSTNFRFKFKFKLFIPWGLLPKCWYRDVEHKW